MIFVVTLLIPITIISGCSTPKIEQIEIVETPRERPALILPKVTQIETLEIEWIVANEQNIDDKFQELKENYKTPVLFALDEENYQNLSLNQVRFLRLIRQQQSLIESYKRYYETQ